MDRSERLALTKYPDGQRVVMRQSWQALTFLHWPVAAEALQALLPPGLTVDTHEGVAYIGLVPFTMRDVRPVWAPSVPGLSHFHETNVRTYVHREGANPGVWFFSLDAANPIAVQIARTLWKLPYFWAEMALSQQDDRISYTSRRKGSGSGCTLTVEVTGEPTPAQLGTLEFFLAERYLLYAHNGETLLSGRVWHTPYPLQAARITNFDDTLCAAAGFANLGPPPLVHYARGVDVSVFPLTRCA